MSRHAPLPSSRVSSPTSLQSAAHELETQIRQIRASELFDPDWYHARYGDVTLLGIGPEEHYLRIGARLLRDPGPHFSTGYYLTTHADVARSGMNPLLHFVNNGRAEGRWASSISHLTAEEVTRVREAFDQRFYMSQVAETEFPVFDALHHYLSLGYKQGLDPTPDFSTSYYLKRAPDVRNSTGTNPFVHYILTGEAEGRRVLPFAERIRRVRNNPKISVIVPNYNHGRFLDQRLQSILDQSYQNIEVIVLDDASSDNSVEVISRHCDGNSAKVRCILNSKNSGNVFRQWRKGVEEARGELVWICESDDFCDPGFLEALVPNFRDRSVNIAFGRIQFADKDGDFRPGLDAYREGAEPGIWSQRACRPAAEWFSNGFGVNNVIANVGGCIFRRQELTESVWDEAESYTVLGDWFLYANLAGGGQIVYEPAAVAFFRQHGQNTSVSAFAHLPFYLEHQRLMTFLKRCWDIPGHTIDAFVGKIAHQYQHFKAAEKFGRLEDHVDSMELKRLRRDRPHILIALLGFHSGGGEVFPINLANALNRSGCLVSLLAMDMLKVNEDMLATLDSSIPVYDGDLVSDMGVDAFLESAGVSLIHSHMLSLEWYFFGAGQMKTRIPYLVTLHGSYEASSATDETIRLLADRVSHWVYTTDRNLDRLRTLQLQPSSFTKMSNAMPLDSRPFPLTRGEMGIQENAVVFTLVARGIPRKGWGTSIGAFRLLRNRNPHVKMHLLLCGDGPETDKMQRAHGEDPDITFLGYQSCIHGLYRLSDCALLPTRYAGESYPLCLIQALQSGTPVIATDIGEIPRIIHRDNQHGGLLISASQDSERFTERLVDAMLSMLSATVRENFRIGATAIAENYDIGELAAKYRSLYDRMLNSHMVDTIPGATGVEK